MKRSESIVNISKAIVDFQKEVKDPKREANNPFFKSKYVTIDKLFASVRPLLVKHGLSYIQAPTSDDHGRIGCVTTLLHESGEFIEGDMFVMTLSKNDPQGAGSAITYARRYSLSAMLGVAWDDDDDGNVATDPERVEQEAKQKKATRQAPKENSKVKEIGLAVAKIAKEKNIPSNIIHAMTANYGCTKFIELNEQQAQKILDEVAKR